MEKEIKLELNKRNNKKIIKFINENFINDKSTSNILKNYKKLCLFLNKENIIINDLDASFLLDNSLLLSEMIFALIKCNIEVLDENIISLVNEYKYDNEIVSNSYKDIDSSKLYLNELGKYDVLTREKEIELSNRIKMGEQDALNELIHHNLKLVVYISKKYTKMGYSFDDVIQNGNIGLIKAAYKFDGNLGYKFSTYAYWWINSEIQEGCFTEKRNIKYPSRVEESVRKISAYIEKYKNDNFDLEPTNEEISNELNIPIKNVIEYRNLPSTISMSYIFNPSSEFALEDVIVDDNVNIEDDYIRKEKNLDIQNELKNSGLDQRSYEIVMLKFGRCNDKLSDKAIGELYGISTSRVKQILDKAIIKLKRNRNLAQLSNNGNIIDEFNSGFSLTRKW